MTALKVKQVDAGDLVFFQNDQELKPPPNAFDCFRWLSRMVIAGGTTLRISEK
jgi:hypothetical protein